VESSLSGSLTAMICPDLASSGPIYLTLIPNPTVRACAFCVSKVLLVKGSLVWNTDCTPAGGVVVLPITAPPAHVADVTATAVKLLTLDHEFATAYPSPVVPVEKVNRVLQRIFLDGSACKSGTQAASFCVKGNSRAVR